GRASTDAEGRFRVALEKPGLLVALRITPEGLPSARFTGPFDSSEENDLSDIQVPGVEKASGRVVDETAKPVPGAKVLIASTGPIFDGDARFVAETRTGADGSFAALDAPEGARVFIVRTPGFVPVNRVQLDGKAAEKISLQRGGTIAGTIVDAEG